MKLRIFGFLLVALSSGTALAEEDGAFHSREPIAAEAGSHLGYANDLLAEHALDERTIDRLGLFDRSNANQSFRYNVELNLENEDTDWSFEVTVTVDF